MRVIEPQPEKPAFKPLTVVFESQDEVDAVYAALCHTAVCEGIRSATSGDIPTNVRDALRASMKDHKRIFKSIESSINNY